MNAKEKLNKIKKENSFHLGFTSNRGVVKHSMPVEDINWLIEQVELFHQAKDKYALIKANIALSNRVLELEKERSEWEIEAHTQKAGKRHLEQQNKRYRDRIEELEAKNWKYIEQNKRYRVAIELVLSIQNYGVASDYIDKVESILSKALEEEEK